MRLFRSLFATKVICATSAAAVPTVVVVQRRGDTRVHWFRILILFPGAIALESGTFCSIVVPYVVRQTRANLF